MRFKFKCYLFSVGLCIVLTCVIWKIRVTKKIASQNVIVFNGGLNKEFQEDRGIVIQPGGVLAEKTEEIDVGCHKDPSNSPIEICEKVRYRKYQRSDNAAILGNGKCVLNETGDEREKLVLITNFVDFRHDSYRNNMHWLLERTQTSFHVDVEQALEARMTEIIHTLQVNLENNIIESIHVLVQEAESVKFLRSLALSKSEKMVIQMVENVTMFMQFSYACRCLKDRIIVICHQDNVLGAGWDKLQPQVLKSEKIFYSLTRHSALGSKCFASRVYNCGPDETYTGSHDTFVFHVKDDITEEMLKPLSLVTPNMQGQEQLLMYMLETQFGYTVLNPCLTLFVHHQHCVPIRDKGRKNMESLRKGFKTWQKYVGFSELVQKSLTVPNKTL
eukprot:gene15488-17066_t